MSHPPETPSRGHRWWGDFDLPTGDTRIWQVGPLELFIRRMDRFWDLRFLWNEDWREPGIRIADRAEEGGAYFPEGEGRRVGLRATSPSLRVEPRLVDRPVVTRPEFDFSLPPGQEVTLYVSTPVTVRLLAEGGRVSLGEVPSWRLSDTWFGHPTQGELCYASRTSCHQDPEGVIRQPNRAITPVVVKNLGRSDFHLDRLALPAPRLSLYEGADGRLWTERLTLEREDARGLSKARRHLGAPEEAGAGARITGPREPSGDSFFIRAFQDLFVWEGRG